MGNYFKNLTHRIIELSEFKPSKVKVVIPCVDNSGKPKLAICSIAYLPEGLLPTKISGWYYKGHGLFLSNKLNGDMAAYDPICSAKPTLQCINESIKASDSEWRGNITAKRLFGFIGSTMLTLLQGGYVIYGDNYYGPMPRGSDHNLIPFRISQIDEVVDSCGEEFERAHPYKRATSKVIFKY